MEFKMQVEVGKGWVNEREMRNATKKREGAATSLCLQKPLYVKFSLPSTCHAYPLLFENMPMRYDTWGGFWIPMSFDWPNGAQATSNIFFVLIFV